MYPVIFGGDSRYSRFPFSLEFESVVVALFRLPSRVRLVIISKKLIAIRRGLSGHRFCLRYSRTHPASTIFGSWAIATSSLGAEIIVIPLRLIESSF